MVVANFRILPPLGLKRFTAPLISGPLFGPFDEEMKPHTHTDTHTAPGETEVMRVGQNLKEVSKNGVTLKGFWSHDSGIACAKPKYFQIFFLIVLV